MTASTALHTAGACRFAAGLWASSDNPVHRAFAPELKSWAARAEARAAASARPEQGELFEGDET